MSEDAMLSMNGDPYYSNLVAIDMLHTFGWSRKRRRKWLRRHGLWVNRARVVAYDRLQWLDDDGLDDFSGEREWCDTCNNLGIILCHCGGDLCVCENYGEMPCPECGY